MVDCRYFVGTEKLKIKSRKNRIRSSYTKGSIGIIAVGGHGVWDVQVGSHTVVVYGVFGVSVEILRLQREFALTIRTGVNVWTGSVGLVISNMLVGREFSWIENSKDIFKAKSFCVVLHKRLSIKIFFSSLQDFRKCPHLSCHHQIRCHILRRYNIHHCRKI